MFFAAGTVCIRIDDRNGLILSLLQGIHKTYSQGKSKANERYHIPPSSLFTRTQALASNLCRPIPRGQKLHAGKNYNDIGVAAAPAAHLEAGCGG